MLHALLAACITAGGPHPCRTDVGAGIYRIIGADASHQVAMTVNVTNPPSAQRETTVEIYEGTGTCAKLRPVSGLFSLFPGSSHDESVAMESGRSLCVHVYKGAASIGIVPGTYQSQVTWQSQTTSHHALSCSVRATVLRCMPAVMTSGTYRIITASDDDIQAPLAFIGGSHKPAGPGPITTHVNLARKAGEVHLFLVRGASCPTNVEPLAPLLDQTFHDGGQMSLNTVIPAHQTLCASVVGTATLATP